MTDFLRTQQDIAFALLADGQLLNINVVTRDRLLQEWESAGDQTYIAEVLAMQTLRNGRKGCAVVVERPAALVNNPNIPGPEMRLRLNCLVVEHVETNEAKDNGTRQPADWVAQRIASLLHLHPLGTSQLLCDSGAITEDKEFAPMRAYRVNFIMRLPREDDTRLTIPSVAENSLSVTFTAGNVLDLVYYTTDGTYPCAVNTSATLYSGAFTVASGTVLRWAAYRDGMTQSGVGQATIT